MTDSEEMRFFIEMCDTHTQAEVARRIGYTPSTVCQVYNGAYGEGKCASPARVLARCQEVFGSNTINCPYLGEIRVGKCAEMRKRPAAALNPDWVKMVRRCRKCGGKP